jgi:flagellar biosynthesis protein FlhB
VVLSIIPMVGFDVLPALQPLQKLRMSRQDIRDEYKQMEGDPHEGRIRQMQRAARRRMMAMCQKPTSSLPTRRTIPLRCAMTKTK